MQGKVEDEMSQSTFDSAHGESMAASLASLFAMPPFAADKSWRKRHLDMIVTTLTRHHYEQCSAFRHILDGLDIDPNQTRAVADQPFLPVSLFKKMILRSVPIAQVSHRLISSGTGRSGRSEIFIDRPTSLLQMRALSRIVPSVIGEKCLPLLVVDAPTPASDPAGYAARSIAIQGFSLFASGRPCFALNDDMTLNMHDISAFLERAGGKPFLMFGFTHVIWRYFLEALALTRPRFDFAHGTMIHGGGWKRLAESGVDERRMKAVAKELLDLSKIHNYYGMVEQPGSIYLQCAHGFFHCSNFSEVFVRRADLSIAHDGEAGILQTVSVLPKSYPGHNLLTEDLGVLHGEDDCACGRKGKYFNILRRLPGVQPKGCGDVATNQ
ncbi:LuxE/PaaK family acyltransferase [Massilia rubra]|uniref:Acyl-protein synthetase n=1 Tax=Massilia rubra TaxID=2607910 RepID=A0ABX0LS16_9BURK|nr:acyl-protein synthetase [Massilia rubra]NHZ36789.1 acyl-protein synthetase [Massilia rubra]